MGRIKNIEKDFMQDEDNVIRASLEEVMHNSIMPYAEYVIMERALPRVEDGLKPVQRRILYTMYELGTMPDRAYRKSARIVGDTMGKYHPHGDTSIYDAMVRMAQKFNMSKVLVDGHGNFGSIDGDSAAAMRYTEARLTPLTMELLRDIEKDTVRYQLNFDDSMMEPQVLPARFPNLLVNGSSGIAVGLATNIPPHNIGEVVEAVIARMKDPNMEIEKLFDIISGPDFPTGGLIIGRDEIENAYKTGRGRITIRAKVDIEKLGGGKKALVISELPYQVNKASMLEKILKLRDRDKGVLNGIADIRDESDRNGIRAVIELKKDAEHDKILNYLYKYSDLQQTFGINMVAIADGKPMQMGLMEIIDYYIEHQKDVLTRRTKYDLKRAEDRIHIVEGLIRALDKIDEIIALIRTSKTPKEARERLIKELEFSQRQAQAILDMRLQRLTNLESDALLKEHGQLKRLIEELNEILSSESKLISVIEDDLMTIYKDYHEPRRTRIIEDSSKAEILEEDLIAIEEIVVTLTRHKFIKSIPIASYNRSNIDADAVDLLEEDYMEYIMHTTTDSRLLLFTNHGNCYGINCHDIPEGRWRDRGEHISTIIGNLDAEEIIIAGFTIKNFEEEKLVQFYTRNGMVKRTKLSEFNSKVTKIQASRLRDGDSIVGVELVSGDGDIILITQNGVAIKFDGKDINPTGRATIGVKGVTLKDGDYVVGGFELPDDGDHLLFLSDNGYMIKVDANEHNRQGRAGVGYAIFRFTKNKSRGNKLVDVALLKDAKFMKIYAKDGTHHTIEPTAVTKGGKCYLPDDKIADHMYVDNIGKD
ncbi:MAG: DNA gyrase subunit A [Clostridiales bacterium]|nr:DNA gyrase subunit A [Clostridiales bacterium]